MSVDVDDQELSISILDITDASWQGFRPDIHDGLALEKILDASPYAGSALYRAARQ